MLEGVDLKKLIDFLKDEGGNGWEIWHPEMFTEMGFSEKSLPIREHRSDGSPKGTITNGGEILKSVKGVYNLDFLYRLGAFLDADYEGKLGRGSQARAITAAVLPILEKRLAEAAG